MKAHPFSRRLISFLSVAALFAFFSFLTACTSEIEKEIPVEVRTGSVDSLKNLPLQTPLAVQLESPEGSMPASKMRDPNLWESHIVTMHSAPLYDTTAMEAFSELARATHGSMKVLADSKFIAEEMKKVIHSRCEAGADVLILIDKTGSMDDDIENVKLGLGDVIAALDRHDNVRLAIGLYGDKEVDEGEWISYMDFGKKFKSAERFVSNISVTGGGDAPESVFEAFFESIDQDFWRSDSKRIILIVGDAPPKEKPEGKYSLSEVVAKATEGKIAMNFYPIVVSLTGEARSYEADMPLQDEKMISTLYPNPTNGPLKVKFNWSDEFSIEIFNISGGLEMTAHISGEAGELNLDALPDGAYFFRAFTTAGDYETRRFVVQH